MFSLKPHNEIRLSKIFVISVTALSLGSYVSDVGHDSFNERGGGRTLKVQSADGYSISYYILSIGHIIMNWFLIESQAKRYTM